MSLKLKLVLAAFVLVYLIIVLYLVRKNKINIKYSFIWLFCGAFMFVALLIPGFIEILAKILGFQTITNMLFFLGIFLLLFISFTLTVIVSTQNKKIRLLIQEISILKSLSGKE